MSLNLNFIKTDSTVPNGKNHVEHERHVDPEQKQTDLEAKKKLEKRLNFLKNVRRDNIKKKEEPVAKAVAPNGIHKDKKHKAPKACWNSKFLLTKLETPIALSTTDGRKRYSIRIEYKDEGGKKKNKTVRFGDKKVQEYVDHHDISRKTSEVSRLQNCQDLFHKNFWRLNLLNNKTSVKEAYVNVMESLQMFPGSK